MSKLIIEIPVSYRVYKKLELKNGFKFNKYHEDGTLNECKIIDVDNFLIEDSKGKKTTHNKREFREILTPVRIKDKYTLKEIFATEGFIFKNVEVDKEDMVKFTATKGSVIVTDYAVFKWFKHLCKLFGKYDIEKLKLKRRNAKALEC